MKALLLIFISVSAFSQGTKQPIPQPMEPLKGPDIELLPKAGGKVLMSSPALITGDLTTDGKTTLKSSLDVAGETKLNGDVKFKPDNKGLHINLKDWHKDSYDLKKKIDNDSILGSIKGKKGLENQIRSISNGSVSDFAEIDLKSYIDFKHRKSLIGKFEGVQINPANEINSFEEFNGDISVPSNKNVHFLSNMKAGDVISRILIDGRTPEQGRRLIVFNNNPSHIGFRIGESDSTIAPKVGGSGIGGTIYIEPTTSFELIFHKSWWVRIGGYTGLSSLPSKGETKVKEYKKICDYSREEGRHCMTSCPKGERIISHSCSILEDENAIFSINSPSMSINKTTWYVNCHTQRLTRGKIVANAFCEPWKVTD